MRAPWPLRIVAGWAADYAWAVAWQVRGVLGRRPPDAWREPSGPPSGPAPAPAPVLLLPGIYETWHFLRPAADRLHAAGHPVHVLAELGRNGGTVDAGADALLARLRADGLHGVVLVAHSKGGLIGKRAMARLLVEDAAGHDVPAVLGMVAVNTPFRGSVHARWFPLRAVRELSDRAAGILALAADVAVDDRIVAVRSRFDPHVPHGADLPGARNELVDLVGHFRVLGAPAVLELVEDAVRALAVGPVPGLRDEEVRAAMEDDRTTDAHGGAPHG